MKKLIFVIILVLANVFTITNLKAQEIVKPKTQDTKEIEYKQDTLIKSNSLSFGGYGGPIVKFTKLNDEFAVLVGVRGGLIINHSFVIGMGGLGLVNKLDGKAPRNNERMNIGYGGLWLDYIFFDKSAVHFSLGSLVGAGGITYGNSENINKDDVDTFFVVEPEVNVMFNITKWFRVGVGFSYRYIKDVEDAGSSDSDLSDMAGSIVFKFGKF